MANPYAAFSPKGFVDDLLQIRLVPHAKSVGLFPRQGDIGGVQTDRSGGRQTAPLRQRSSAQRACFYGLLELLADEILIRCPPLRLLRLT